MWVGRSIDINLLDSVVAFQFLDTSTDSFTNKFPSLASFLLRKLVSERGDGRNLAWRCIEKRPDGASLGRFVTGRRGFPKAPDDTRRCGGVKGEDASG